MDNQILRQLYEEYGRELFLYLYSLCKSREKAEDLLQETFLKAMLSLSEEHTNMRAWLYIVGRNLCYNTFRREKKEILLEKNTTEMWDRMNPTDSCELVEQFIEEEGYRMLYQALAELKPIKREILELQYFGGLALKEISEIVNLRPENVRVLSHRAKAEVRKYMEEAGYEIS